MQIRGKIYLHEEQESVNYNQDDSFDHDPFEPMRSCKAKISECMYADIQLHGYEV